MLIRIAALGALGYAGYRLWRSGALSGAAGSARVPPPLSVGRQPALAGGPLSGEATLIHPGEDMPRG